MNNKKIQNELRKLKGDTGSIKNSSHEAFVEKLRKQVSSDDSSSSTGDTDLSYVDVNSEEFKSWLGAKFDELFESSDDDD